MHRIMLVTGGGFEALSFEASRPQVGLGGHGDRDTLSCAVPEAGVAAVGDGDGGEAVDTR